MAKLIYREAQRSVIVRFPEANIEGKFTWCYLALMFDGKRAHLIISDIRHIQDTIINWMEFGQVAGEEITKINRSVLAEAEMYPEDIN